MFFLVPDAPPDPADEAWDRYKEGRRAVCEHCLDEDCVGDCADGRAIREAEWEAMDDERYGDAYRALGVRF